jgi:hypothetical protein
MNKGKCTFQNFGGNDKISQNWCNLFFNLSFMFSVFQCKELGHLIFFPKDVSFDNTLSGTFKFHFQFLVYNGT